VARDHVPARQGRAEASVFYRFLLASLVLFAFCLARRLPLRFRAREHLWIALFGALMFCVSYIFVYYAEEHVVLGSRRGGYSASPLLGLIGMRLVFKTPMTGRLFVGAMLAWSASPSSSGRSSPTCRATATPRSARSTRRSR
jgi:drug/metabolite transporter (DMT)-like permease